ncbi:MAG: TIM barrel protein [Moorea sp. SIO4G3]|nr:TIM barrel protein [Moorena sp. SIO4G3]
MKQQVQTFDTEPKELKSFLKQISRLLIALAMALLIGITTALPANANATVTFENANNVRLGITPTGWSNSDDLTIDTNPPIPYQQILSEIALSGFEGTQGSPKFPSKEELKPELDLRGLTISEPWVGTYFTLGDEGKRESERIFDDQIQFMKGFDSNIIVVAELGGAVHQQPIDPLKNRPSFNNDQWTKLIEGLNYLGGEASNQNMQLVYHPHVGTGVETPADIDRLMNGATDFELLLDTGHLYYAIAQNTSKTSTEILADIQNLVTTYASHIKHVHLKNIRESVLRDSINNGWSFLDSIRAGVFTVPGDSEGVINFNPILKTLADAKYEGWLIVEAEQDPNTTMGYDPSKTPLDYALMARDYLCEQTGL